MFKKHFHRRSTNIVFVIFRLVLSMVMFGLLFGGVYQAYKHFSGLDPFKLDPQAVLKSTLGEQLLKVLGQVSLRQDFGGQVSLSVSQRANTQSATQIKPLTPQTKYTFRFLLVADSHSDNANLKKAISQAKQAYPDLSFIIGLGDYTEVGTLVELRNVKIELDSSGLRYFLIPGDHDPWDSRDKQTEPTANFKTVFGPAYQSFTYQKYQFLLLYNSDNYKGMGDEQLKWLTSELQKAKDESLVSLVFVHEPLYHPSSDHFMGRVEQGLRQQAKMLIRQLKDLGIKKVFAGDTHYFSEYEEPEAGLPMMTIGAVTIERNPQTPRFAVVYVFEDGDTKIEDVEIK